MKKTRLGFAAGLIAVFSACSGLKVHENEKNRTLFAQATGDAGQQVQSLQQVWELQRKILKRSPPNPTGRANLDQGERELKSLKLKYETLRETTGAYSAYAYSNPRVFSHEPGWAKAEQWQEQMQEATNAFRSQLDKTTKTLDEGIRHLTQTGLYRKKSSRDLAEALQEDTELWRRTYEQWAEKFKSAQENLSDESARDHLLGLQKNLNQMAKMIETLDQFKEDFLIQFSGRIEVTNLDSDWGLLEKSEAKRNGIQADWRAMVERTQTVYDRFNRASAGSATQSP